MFTRADAVTRLDASLAEWLAKAGLSADDEHGAMVSAIDDALVQDLGVAWSDRLSASVADADVPGFLVLLEWRGLRRIRAALGPKGSDASSDGTSESRSQLIGDLTKQIDILAGEAAPFRVGSGGGFAAGTITLDILEPWPAWA